MTRSYEVLLPLTVHTEDGAYTQGETFEKEFNAVDEAENVASGLLAIVPMTYKVVGDSRVHGVDPGGTFDMALPLGQEELLVEGGHIVRVDTVKPKTSKTKATKEEAN